MIPERERALGLYQRAWKLHPDNLKALSRAREVYGELGRHEMVAKLGEMELKSPAAIDELAGIVGEALLDSGQRDKAETVLAHAAERTPDALRVKDALAALRYDPEFWLDEVERLTAEAAKFDDVTGARMLLRAARILRIEAPDDPSLEQTLRAALDKDLHEPSANVMLEALLAAGGRLDELEAHHERRAQAIAAPSERADLYRAFALAWLQRFKERDRAARFAAKAMACVAHNGARPTRSVVATYAILLAELGERGAWDELVSLGELALGHLEPEDRLFVAVTAGRAAWKQLGDVERARRQFAAAAAVQADAPDVLEFVAANGPVDAPAASAVSAAASEEPAAAEVTPAAPVAAAAEPTSSEAAAPAAPVEAAPVAPVAAAPVAAAPVAAAPVAAAPVAAAPVAAPVSGDVAAAMDAARAAERGADGGVAAWKDVVANHGDALPARRELARVLAAAGQWQALVDAARDEDKVASAPADKAAALRSLAQGYEQLGNENQVMSTLVALVAVAPSDDAYDQLAALYENKKRWPDLVKLLGERAEHATDDGSRIALHLQIANLYLDRFSNQAEAIKAFERVLELEPDNAQATTHLLAVYEKRRDWEKLIKLREGEIERAPAAQRAELTIDVARMAQTKVKKPEVCTYWWEKVIEVEPTHEEALTELTKLYERSKDWGKLAEVCSLQADNAGDDKTRADALQRLGLLYTEKLEDNAKAIDAWQRLLVVDESHRRAQDALKKLFVADARWDDLDAFYRSRGKLDEYVRVLEREVEAGPEEHRLALATKIAVLYRDELAKPDRAMRAYEKVLSLDEHNLDAAEALIPLYEAGRDPKKLVGALEIQLAATQDPVLRQERLKRLAEYNEEKLRDKGAAFGWWLKAYAEDHEAEWIRAELERLAKDTGAWTELVAAYGAALPKYTNHHDALPVMSVMATALEQELGQGDRALELNRQIVELDANNQDALDALERLYLGRGQFQALLDVYTKKLDLTHDVDERVDIQAKIGQLYEDEVKDDGKAIAAYQGILDAVGDEPKALAALDRVFLRNQRWKDLADILSRQITTIGPDDDRAKHLEFKFRLGQVREAHLAEVPGAIEVYRDILDLEPGHAGARGRLEHWLAVTSPEHAEARLAAAAILEPIYEQLGEWRALVGVHEIQVDAAGADGLRKVGLLLRIGELERTKLGDVERAFAAYGRAFREDPATEAAKAHLVELAPLADKGWARLTDLFEQAVGRADLAPSLAHELATDVARNYEERLGKSDRAVVFFKKALELEPDDGEALTALEAIFARDEKYPELLEVYHRKAEIAAAPDERLAVLFRIATIHEEMLGQPAEAIRAYGEVLAQDADNLQALRALDRLYVAGSHWQDLGDNLTRQLTLCEDDGEQVLLLNRLASLREQHLGESAAAIETYRQVLELDGSNRPAVAALERLLTTGGAEHELAIAGILEPIYKAEGAWQKQIGVYEIMARHAFDPARKIELFHQIAELHEIGGDDAAKAFDTHARALRDDPRHEGTAGQLERLARVQDRWTDLVALYDGIVTDTTDEDLKVALLFKQAQIHEHELGNDPAAVATYQRVLAVAPGSVEAATAIQRIHERNGDWPALVKALKKKSEILLDLTERKELLYRAAQIEEEVLSDKPAAVATFQQVLAIDDVDVPAMDALVKLHLFLKQWEPLKDIYAKKADLADDPAEKSPMLKVLGQVYDRELGDVAKSIETYQAILDIDPDDDDAIRALDRLYGQAERWYDLLANLERQVELSEMPGEIVGLKYRIGQLWQTRLGDQARAIESYREALAMEPSHGETLAALDGMIRKADGEPVAAARVLEPIYEAGGEYGKLVEVLEVVISHTEDPLARVDLLHRVTSIHEAQLGDPKAAFASLARALKDDPANELTLGHLERLAELTGQWTPLAALYASEAEKSLDVPRQVDLLSRLARVNEQELGDVDKAIATFRRILDVDFDNRPAVLALDRLYTATGKWKELADVLRREIRLAESDEEVVALQFRLGQTLDDALDDKKGAIEVFREILMTSPDHADTQAALEALFFEGHHQNEIAAILEPLHETAGEFEKLHRIYEVQLGKLTVAADRAGMHQRLAELAETRLYDPARAFGWWGEAVVEDPASAHAIDEAERLAGEAGAWDDLVNVYTRALGRHADPELRRQTLLRLARVHEFEQRDAHAAVTTHLRVLEIDAKDVDALAALDRLYLGAGMYDELVEVLRRRIEVTQDPDEQTELQFRRGAVFSDALGDLDQALGCYRAILEQESRNRRALECVEAIYFRREAWAPLYDTYEQLIDVADGDSELADTYARMARLSSEALSQDDRAIDLWGRVLDIRGEDTVALAALADIHQRLGKYEELVEVLERQVAVSASDRDQIRLYKRLGRVWADHLHRERSSLDAWLCADRLDPNDFETLTALAGLYRSTQSWDELSQTLRRIIDVGQDQDKVDEDQVIALYSELGRIEGDVLGRVDEAVTAWRSVLAIDAGDFGALEQLEGLFTREARWEEAIEVLEKRALVQEDQSQRIDTLLQAGATWEEKVEDLDGAAQVYERVRAMDNANPTASARLEAIYRAQYQWAQLTEVLLERAGQREDVQEQISLLAQVAKIYEQELGDQDNAYVVLEEAFKRDFSHEGTAAELERLATATNRWQELLGEYTHQVRDLESSNRGQAADLWVKIGRWYGEHLAHIDYAIHSVQQALRIDPAHVGALAALAELQRKRGAWSELVETLSRQAASEKDASKRAEVNLALGELLENQVMDQGQAIAAYQSALVNDPSSVPVLASLERLYRFHQMWEPLIDVLGRKAALAGDEDDVIRLRLDIGQIYDLRLHDAGAAIGSYQKVLDTDPTNLPALSALEQLYEKTDQSEKYLAVLEAQLDAQPSDAQRVALYERMASAWEERFGKLDRAAEALEKIVALDGRNYGAYRELSRLYHQAGRWEALVETYRNHILNTTDASTRIDLYCAMGVVYERELQDYDRSIEAYTDVLGFDSDEPRALDALGRLYEKISDWDRAIEVMARLVHLIDDPKKRVDLYHRIGRIQYAQLGDVAEAEANFVRGLSIEPGHVATMEALTKLYADRGDWLKAAQMMERAEAHTPVVLDKVRLLHEAARIYSERLHDTQRAKPLFAAVIALDPEHVEAGKPLAEAYFEDEEWAALAPVIEMLVRKVGQSRPDPRELNELYYRAARTADALGDYDRAQRHYEAAYNIDSTYLPTLIGRADLLFKTQDWDGASKIYQTILVQHRDSQPEAEVVRIYNRMGMVRQNLGERKKALNMFEKALEIDPSHRDTLQAVIALQVQQNDWEAVVHAKRGLLASASDAEKVALLDEIGGIYQSNLANPGKAVGAYLEALEVTPDDHSLLQKVLDLYTETKQWKKVVETIQRFIDLETEQIRRGSYYLAAGAITRDELKATDEAIDFYNLALDNFFEVPSKLNASNLHRALKAFESIDKILTTKKDWKAQERAYRQMIKRIPQPDPAAGEADTFHTVRIGLLHALGEIYRSRLGHFQSAISAFEVAQELDAGNRGRAEILAELYTRAGADYADKAIAVHMKMLRDEPFKYDSYQALDTIYRDAHQYDKRWCMCATLTFLKKADRDQVAFYEQYKPRGLVKAKAVMTPDSWGKLIHPDENRYISAIMGAVWSGVAAMHAYPHKELGIKRKDKRPLATDQVMFSKIFYYVGQVLSVPIPEVFLIADQKPADIQLANFTEKNELCPSFVVREHLLSQKTDRDIAFLSARRLTFMRPEYYLKLLLQTNTELKVALLSAISLVRPDFPVPPDVFPLVQQYKPEIQRRLNPAVFEQLAVVVNRFIQAAPQVDLARWGHAVDAASHRAGFVVCGDLEVAARLVSAEPVTVGGPQVKDKIKELVLYSISEEYFAVRQQMGVTIG
ncbi:MAG: tetratricopeptide repeat protein [Kofleriaceae bacterium]